MKKFTLTLFILCFAIMAYAVPAQRVAKVVKQADGTELTVYLVGDEFFHYYTTADNVPLALAADGSYYYATVSGEGFLVPGIALAHNKELRSSTEQMIVERSIQGGIMQHINATHQARAMRANLIQRANSNDVLPEGEVNVPVLLVEYADVQYSFTKEQFERMLNEEGYDAPTYYSNVRTIGSAKDYFSDQSNGKFIPNFVVSDIVTLSKNREYYGANNSSGNDVRATYMVKEACQLLDEKIDFSIFDNNKDGEVEFVYCIYAGHNEAISGADPNFIWPHKWYLSAQAGAITLDGVRIDEYACSSECFGLPEIVDENGNYYINGYGAMCHEFSHCLGLPDFYDTGSAGSYGMGEFSVMDSGCYNAGGFVPVGYSAYEKDFLGWAQIEELTEPEKYSLEPFIDSNKAYKIVNDANSDEYYVLEYRIKKSWDAYMHAEGLMITHVDYNATAWYQNVVNNTPSHQRMSVIPADGKLSANTVSGDFWPLEGATALTDESNPAAKVYTGGFMGKPITNITKENGVISFNFMGGVYVETPTVQPATDITATGFTANWLAVEGTQKYNVDLYKLKYVGDTGELEEDTYVDPIDQLQGAAPEEYAGEWTFAVYQSGESVGNATATISVVEENGKTLLACKGFSCVKKEFGFDDTFYLQYDQQTGRVTLDAQYVNDFVYDSISYKTAVYLTDTQRSSLFGGTLIGGFKDGKIVFINDDANANIADSFAYIYTDGTNYYLLSYFNALEWSSAENTSSAPVCKAREASMVIEQPQRVMRAEVVEEEETLLYENFAGFTDTKKSIKDVWDNYFSTPGWTGTNLYSESGKMRIGTTVIAGSAISPVLTSEKRVVVSILASLYDTSDTGVALTFSYVKGDEETVICTRKVKDAGEIKFSFLPEGDFKLKISTADATGKKRVAISQLRINERLGVTAELIQSVETEETNYTFSGLETDTEYKYSVVAVDAEGNTSLPSDFEFVVLGTVDTSIDVVTNDVAADGIYDLSGRRVINFERNGVYIVRKGGTVTKIMIK